MLGEDETSALSRVRRPLPVMLTFVMPTDKHRRKQTSWTMRDGRTALYHLSRGVLLPAEVPALLGWLLCKLTAFAGTESCSCLSLSWQGQPWLFTSCAVRFNFSHTAEEPSAAKAREPFPVLRSSF